MSAEKKYPKELFLKNLQDNVVRPTSIGVWTAVKHKKHPLLKTHLYNLVDRKGEVIEEGSLIDPAASGNDVVAAKEDLTSDAEGQAEKILQKEKEDAAAIKNKAKDEAVKILEQAQKEASEIKNTQKVDSNESNDPQNDSGAESQSANTSLKDRVAASDKSNTSK